MKIKDLTFSYEDKKIFNNFNLEIPHGKVTCIMGASGGGKTTLLNCICSQLKYQGQILYGQNGDNSLAQKRVAYVFQNPRLIPSLTVEENIDYVLPQSISKEQRKIKVDNIIKRMQLEDCAKSYPRYISGGQASRVSLARALVVESDILLMDEPFKGLDIKLKKQILDILSGLIEGKTVVFVTHDIEEALSIADKVCVLDRSEGECIKMIGEEYIDCPRDVRDIYSPQYGEIRQRLHGCLIGDKTIAE